VGSNPRKGVAFKINKMVKAHEIKLYPTKSQEVLLRKSCGVARFTYNWALNKWIEDYKKGIKWSAYSLVKHLNSIKRIEFTWMQETGKTCSQYAIHHVEVAFKKMWKEKAGYPKFKKKGAKDSFVAVENKQQFKQSDFKIHIPRIGKIKCSENLRFEGKVNNVVVKRMADMWFAVINIEIEDIPIKVPMVSENQTIVGIDMGIKSMMILSDGTIYENPKALKSNLKCLKRLQRGLSRKKKGSNNIKKQQVRVARKYYHISCIRRNAIHKATSEIVKKYDKIVIETLRPCNMVKNHKLAQSINDVSFGEISIQLAYKAQWEGKELVKADQWFASSKTCSKCGNKKKVLKLSERSYHCDNCGFSIDRDLNAAINLANYSPTSKFEGSKACGEGSSVLETKHSPSAKHEIIKLSHKIVQECTLP
jgi:putative transposase